MSARTQSIVSASEPGPSCWSDRAVHLDSRSTVSRKRASRPGELTVAPGQQGPDRVVVGIDGGQPERQDRGAARRRPAMT